MVSKREDDVTMIGKLPKVKDRKKLPPNVEHKILTKEEMKKRKKEATENAKLQLNNGIKNDKN